MTVGDLEDIGILKSTYPVAWRNVNLVGTFDFTTSSSLVDIEARPIVIEAKTSFEVLGKNSQLWIPPDLDGRAMICVLRD